MSEEQKPLEPEEIQSKTLKIHFIKSHHFRVIHVDGAWGAITPDLNIQMAVYSERRPIPQQLIQEILPDGSLGAIVEGISREGIVREVEADLVMDMDTARAISVWLKERIERLEELYKADAE